MIFYIIFDFFIFWKYSFKKIQKPSDDNNSAGIMPKPCLVTTTRLLTKTLLLARLSIYDKSLNIIFVKNPDFWFFFWFFGNKNSDFQNVMFDLENCCKTISIIDKHFVRRSFLQWILILWLIHYIRICTKICLLLPKVLIYDYHIR